MRRLPTAPVRRRPRRPHIGFSGMLRRGIAGVLLVGLFAGGCGDVPATAPSMPSAANTATGSSVGDVAGPLTGTEPGAALPNAGHFSARIVNKSASTADVTLEFTLGDTTVHQTTLRKIRPGKTMPVAGPELARRLVVTEMRADTGRTATTEYVFGVDVEEGGEVVYVIADPQVPAPDPEPPPPLLPDDADVTSNGPVDVDTGGLADAETNGTSEPVDTEDHDHPDPPPPPPIPDCNDNGVDDTAEIAAGRADDCNGNAVPNVCDISSATSADCNSNDQPDECDLAAGSAADCNTNSIPDACEISLDAALDCDVDGVIDACAIRDGLSPDCNSNAVPDACDTDCDGDGLPDDCAIATGQAVDANANGVPDACECPAMDTMGPAATMQLLSCLAGPAETLRPDAVTCRCFDFDYDGDVDLRDFAYFQSLVKP